MSEWATPRYRNLPPEKAMVVLNAAVDEFAEHGYHHANTNRIAERAGISVGALFKYFVTKEHLFRHVVVTGISVIDGAVADIVTQDIPPLERVRLVLHKILEMASDNQGFVRLYHEITTNGNQDIVHQLALSIERYSRDVYVEMIREGQQAGEIRDDLDPGAMAWTIDTMLTNFLYAQACPYFVDRCGMYVPDLTKEEMVDQLVAMLTAGLASNR